jgi:hypothetical protein
MYDLEHPEITCAQQTGFPSWKQQIPPKCELCGYELYLDEMYEDSDHEFLCEECLLKLHRKNPWN